MEAEKVASRLRIWAREEGFDRAGIARLGPTEHGDSFVRWLERGEHAGMEYLKRRTEARLDPRQLLEGARSALCVALQYAPAAAGREGAGDLWPSVARYAHGEDYHRIMERRLRRLAERIRTAFPGCGTRPYVDTGPVLERELAAAAGLGVIGKNTNLLHPTAGSWFLLGELLLTLDLEPDPPLADLCGSCTRCLEACPTGALPEPYRLDSNLCISYWTIEHRGSIPRELRDRFEGWVFGCDICQEVCPWNDAAVPQRQEVLERPPQRRNLDLAGLLTMDRDEYVEAFRHSAMKRAKLGGLKRNAAVAAGHRRDPAYVAPLGVALENEDPEVRAHAAWALGRIGGRQARAVLERAALEEADSQVRLEIEASLGRG